MTAPTESAALMPATANVDALEIVGYAGDEATVALEGRLTETFFDARSTESQLVTTDISGPVSLIRRGGEWRVADHHRDGRVVTEQVRRLKGSQASSGLTVEPLASTCGRRAPSSW